jgi:NADH:ubiquinone oxidoreductase subunit 4 (subunit M)
MVSRPARSSCWLNYYERKHTYEIKDFGGLATPMPIYATFFLFVVLASVGLPMLNGLWESS